MMNSAHLKLQHTGTKGYRLLLAILAAFSTTAQATESHQSFETCSMITSEYLTVVQLHQRGIAAESLAQSLPGLSEKGRIRMESLHRITTEDGGDKTFEKINAEYARCAKSVYQRTGMPTPDSREFAFYFCAGENKRRYEILLAIQMGGKREEVLPQLSENHQAAALALYEMFEKDGIVPAYDSLASEFKLCLNSIP